MRSVSEFMMSSIGQSPPLTKNDSVVGGQFMNILNGNCRWLCWSSGMVCSRNSRGLQKFFESGRPKNEQIPILDVARIAYLVGNITGGDERVAGQENKHLPSDIDLEFSREDKVGFVLTSMSMPRHTDSRREVDFQNSFFTPGTAARLYSLSVDHA